jgi:hypothetical protein
MSLHKKEAKKNPGHRNLLVGPASQAQSPELNPSTTKSKVFPLSVFLVEGGEF